MPIGKGDVTVIAWANTSQSGVSFYVQKQDALAETSTPLKIALIHISTNPYVNATTFNQTLDVATATFIYHWSVMLSKHHE